MENKNMAKSDILNLPINKEICFSNHKKEFKEKIMKDQTKILMKFTSFLRQLLERGEEILLAVKATSPMPFLEQWTTGWVIYYIKRCVLIFTNKRIIHFPTKSNFSPKHSVSQIRYGDIEDLRLSGFLGRVLKIEYKSGKKETFYYIESREYKKLKTLQFQFTEGHQPSKAMERHFLCPKCITPLQKNIFSCPNCHLEFKNVKDAIRLSIIFPGGGYFYAGHPVLGIMDAITEGILLIALIAKLLDAFKGLESWISVLFIAVLLFIEKLITIYHVKHYISEYIPVDKNIGMASLHPSPEPFSPYKPPLEHKERKWPKLAFAIGLLIFSMSFLAWKVYPYLAERFQAPTQTTLRDIPPDPEKERAMSVFLKTKYTVINDYDKWVPVLYQNKDFDAIEKQVSDLLGKHDDEAKAYELYILYDTLALVREDEDIELKKGVLDEWCSKHPESHIAWLTRGNFYIDYAWHIRGGAYAKDVPKDAWPKFHAMLEQAQKDLEKSWELNPKDPNSSCNLITVAMGRNYPKEKMEQYFKNAMSVCPWHFGAHVRKLEYLKPKWHGSSKEMYDFATDCLRFAERYPFLGLIMVNVLEEEHKHTSKNENYLGKNGVWTTVEKIYTNFFDKYPEDIRRRFFYAYHAYRAQKYDAAINQFEIIGDRWMENTSWKSLEEYHSARAFVYSAYAFTLTPPQGVDYLKKAIAIEPTDKISHFNLGVFSAKIGRFDEAEASLLKAIELDPCFVKAQLYLSWHYGKNQRDLVKAKEYAEKVLNCSPSKEEEKEAKNYVEFCNNQLKK
jgi:tetratricopeptide (TPR) repeat protein